MKDNKSENKTFNVVDWENELKPFMEDDINKPGWTNSYTVDSSKSDTNTSLNYTAKDSSLPIKKINIISNSDKIIQVNILSGKQSNLYNLSTELNYDPLKGYTIKSAQKVRFVQQTNFEIRTEFINNK